MKNINLAIGPTKIICKGKAIIKFLSSVFINIVINPDFKPYSAIVAKNDMQRLIPVTIKNEINNIFFIKIVFSLVNFPAKFLANGPTKNQSIANAIQYIGTNGINTPEIIELTW